MKERIFEWLKIILFFMVAILVIGFLQSLGTEDPHEITIDGKKYIRSKEYVGDGHYQIIITPKDSTK
jgi:hypothetical protein